jgi:hypothetical protein
MVGFHYGHSYRDMADVFNSKKSDIEKETKEIESTIIPQYKRKNEEMKSKLSMVLTEFDKMEKIREKNRKYWHQEVDTIFDKLGSLMKSTKGNLLAALHAHQFKIINPIQNMNQTIQQNKKILKSSNVSEVTSYQSKLQEYRNMPADVDVQLPVLKTNTVQGEILRLELGDFKAGLTRATWSSVTKKASCLSMPGLLNQAKLIATIPTGVNPLYNIACVGVDEAWVSGTDQTLRRVDINGSVCETVTTKCQYWPTGIAVTMQGEPIYSDYNSRTLNIVIRGLWKTMITTPKDWHPDKLCCTKSGDILVSMENTDQSQSKIVRYKGHTVMQELYGYENGKPIYKAALYVVENNNGDVCVSNRNAGMVVVVNKSGRVRFRYDGAPALRKEPFYPVHIVTDSMSQIIVADYNNACLHILDQNGQFLRCEDNCGLDRPDGLSVDSKGRLWVGSSDSGDVKVIQYMK